MIGLEQLWGPLVLSAGVVAGGIIFNSQNKSGENKAALEKYNQDVKNHNRLAAQLANQRVLDLDTIDRTILDDEAKKAVSEYEEYLKNLASSSKSQGQQAVGEVKLVGIDEATAAMVMAILCHELNDTALNFKSIKAR